MTVLSTNMSKRSCRKLMVIYYSFCSKSCSDCRWIKLFARFLYYIWPCVDFELGLKHTNRPQICIQPKYKSIQNDFAVFFSQLNLELTSKLAFHKQTDPGFRGQNFFLINFSDYGELPYLLTHYKMKQYTTEMIDLAASMVKIKRVSI